MISAEWFARRMPRWVKRLVYDVTKRQVHRTVIRRKDAQGRVLETTVRYQWHKAGRRDR